MVIRRACSALATAACAQVVGLVLVVTPGLAHTPSDVGSFAAPHIGFGGVAVEQSTQDVFVMDDGSEVVQKFSAGGAALLTEFNASETPATRFNPAYSGGVAVDESSTPSKGDVYVAAGGFGVVDKFKPKAGGAGEYEYMCELTGPGGGCTREGGEPTTSFSPFVVGVAIDSQGDVYVADYLGKAIYEFGAEGGYLGKLEGKDITVPFDVATGPGNVVYVNNFSGTTVKVNVNAAHEVASESILDPHETGGVAVDPGTGDVYVTDAEGGWHVAVYGPNGAIVENFATKGELTEASRIAYSTHDGRTYVVDKGAEQVVVYAEGPEVETGRASGVGSSGGMLNGTVSPNDPSAEWRFEYGETSSYGAVTSAGTVTSRGAVSAAAEGLKPGAEYHYRLAATNSRGTVHGSDMTFLTGGSVTDKPAFASNVSQSTATLNATIDPGSLVTSYHFVYGLTAQYGSVLPLPDLFIEDGVGDVKVSLALTGLQAGRTYHFAVVITDAAGVFTGPDQAFTTASVPLPVVSTGGSSAVSQGAATLAGTIDPLGWGAVYHFEYGTSTAYGASWPTADVKLGALVGNQPVQIVVGGLQPATTYHYRLVASNPGGTSYGSDEMFTTSQYPASVVQETPVLTVSLGFLNPESQTGKSRSRSLSRAQKLTNALNACRRKPKRQRGQCEKQARARYGPVTKKKK
jgi:hypothetical protein